MKALFIGGPKAGQMVEVEPAFGRIQFPILLPDGFGSISYTPRLITDDAGSTIIYVLEGSDDPLRTLMQFYADGDHSVERDK